MEEMLNELRLEAETTKRLLDLVPEDKLGWRPHPKSMSLGQLALHVASIPGALSRLAQFDEFDAAKANFEPAEPESTEMVMSTWSQSIAEASEYLASLSPDAARAAGALRSEGTRFLRCGEPECFAVCS